MHELDILEGKIAQLLKKYAALEAENNSLRQTVAKQTRSMETLNGKMASLEESLLATQIGKNVLSDKEKQVVRKQLDTVIGEIDKILIALND